MKFKKAYVPRERTGTVNTDETITEQNHKNSCDINVILARATQTQTIAHVNAHEPMYGDITPDDLLQSLLTVKKAEQMFSDLPSKLRKKFDFMPEKFLQFVQDPANKSEMIELGLVQKQEKMANMNDVVEAIKSQTAATQSGQSVE